MYCVIQEIQLKKPNPYGEYRELEAYSPFTHNGRAKYAYQYTGGRFERPIQTAYKISVHESKRVNGVVTKRQYVVTTVDYYNLATGWFALGDYDRTINGIAEKLDTDAAALYDLLYGKLDPLEARVKGEYQKTEECKTHSKHQKIIKKYLSQKEAFVKAYGVSDTDQYDYCYNIYGEVMNQAYIDEIIATDRQRQRTYSSYRKQSSSNYSTGGYDYSSLLSSIGSTYSEAEKMMLKKFYKALSMKFHPDMNPDADTTGEMQLLNKLKDNWGI